MAHYLVTASPREDLLGAFPAMFPELARR